MDVPDAFKTLFQRCHHFRMANALLTKAAMDSLRPSLQAALERGAVGAIIIGLDLFAADPNALRGLLRLSAKYGDALDCRLFKLRPTGIFHPKLALFDLPRSARRAIVGSSNLSAAAWTANIEADAEIASGPTIGQLADQFDAWLEDERCLLLDDAAIRLAEKLWNKHALFRRSIMPSGGSSGGRTQGPALRQPWQKRDSRLPARISGHSFAITGAFQPKGGPWIKREPDLVDEVASYGGRLLVHTKSAASADFFIIASPSMYPGNYRGAKQDLADERGTPEMTQEEFWELLRHERRLASRRKHRSP